MGKRTITVRLTVEEAEAVSTAIAFINAGDLASWSSDGFSDDAAAQRKSEAADRAQTKIGIALQKESRK